MADTLSQHQNNPPRLFRHTQTTLGTELRWIIDHLLPARCPLCFAPICSDNPSQLLCPTCTTQLHQSAPSCCPRCAEPYIATCTTPHLCSRCLHQPPAFVWLKAATLYDDNVANAVHQFKYQGKTTLAAALAQCMLQQLGPDILNFQPQLLMPVPLHSSRLRQRGYNQSLLLTRELARQLNLPISINALRRDRSTSSQTQLNAQQRLRNLRNAFSIKDKLSPQRILLIDDVVTTTATARACAKTLCAQGHSVAVVALGRASLT